MYSFAPGVTSKSIQFKLRDATTGQPKTLLTASSAGAACGYVRAGGAGVAIPLVALSGPTAAWAAGGFAEIDAANSAGTYRLDLPDAALAAGVDFTTVSLGFTGVLGEGALVLLQQPASPAGSGTVSWTVTVNNSATTLPLAGASAWVTTDQQGANVVAGPLTTSALGQVTFLLNPGSYYLWVTDAGYTGTNPTSITVS
jgi:hypothetical protein